MEVERQAADLLREKGEDINGLLILAWTNLLLENRQRSVSIVYRIWDLGGEFTEYAHVAYADNLINLGLLEMASMLLKTRFEEVEKNAPVFGKVMLKFAIATGNLSLMKRLISFSAEAEELKLSGFVDVYAATNYAEHFKYIQRIVNGFFKNEIYAYAYNVYDDRGFTDLEVLIYLGKETPNRVEVYKSLEKGINQYLEDKGVKRIYNLGFVLKDIKDYPSLEQDQLA